MCSSRERRSGSFTKTLENFIEMDEPYLEKKVEKKEEKSRKLLASSMLWQFFQTIHSLRANDLVTA